MEEPSNKRRQTLRGQHPVFAAKPMIARFSTSNNGRKIKSPTMRSTNAVAPVLPHFSSKKKKRRARRKRLPTEPTPKPFFPRFQKRSNYAAHFRQFLSLSSSFLSGAFFPLFFFLEFFNGKLSHGC